MCGSQHLLDQHKLSLLFYLLPVQDVMCLTNVLQDQYHTISLDKTFIL